MADKIVSLTTITKREEKKNEPVPPAELVAKCAEINAQWLSGEDVVLELYLSPDEWGDTWKFRIIFPITHTVLCDHLDPTAADGHTYRLLVGSYHTAHKNGFQDGMVATVANWCASMCRNNNVDPAAVADVLRIMTI